jgi:lipopolysaccharide export system protein LptC
VAWAEDRYSRLIGWLKVALPLTALALLSTVFLLSRGQDASTDLPYAEIDVGEDGLVERVLRPSFAGATKDGDLIAFVAETARAMGKGLGKLSADDVRARIDLRTGGTITFRSDTAVMDQPEGLAELKGGVVIVSSSGYTAETETLRAGLRDLFAETDGQIHAEGPLGKFVAGRMRLTTEEDGETVQMLFTDGVKLVYLPQSQ